MKYQKLVIVLVLSLITVKSVAQLDPIFFNLNVVNPAFVGSKDKLSVGVDYSLYNFNFDTFKPEFIDSQKIFLANVYTSITDNIGVGLSFINVKNGFLKEKLTLADFSYKLNLSDKSQLRIGFKSGFSTLKIDNTSFILPGGEPDNPNEVGIKESNLRLGFGFHYKINDFQAGISIPNIIKAKEFGDSSKIIKLFSAYKFELNDLITFEPNIILSIPTSSNVYYYVSGNFEIKNIINIGINHNKLFSNNNLNGANVLGIQLSSPLIARIFRVGFVVSFVDNPPFDNSKRLDLFGNFDFNPIN